MASIPIIKQTDATKELQFKLYASKFPVWWTHNSVDKPDPTYFDHLNDDENPDGFNWVEVPFTFNYRNQFEGSIVTDNQYYTIFKLVDSKDTNFSNKYYLTENVNKSFNGGYELQVKLDVFTTYGLDFWVNGVNNPDINSKTITLNRTNNPLILLNNYYNYTPGHDVKEFSNWIYPDPLLDFTTMPTVGLAAAHVNYTTNSAGNKLYLAPFVFIANDYQWTWNGSSFDLTNDAHNNWYSIVGIAGLSKKMRLSTIRYYVFKPLLGESDQYWAFWTIIPRQWQAVYTSAKAVPQWSTEVPLEQNLKMSASAIYRDILNDEHGAFGNKLIGVFDAPPLSIFGNRSFGGENMPYQIETSFMNIGKSDGKFLISKIYITPDRIVPGIPVNPMPSNVKELDHFKVLNILQPGKAPNVGEDLTSDLFSSDMAIRYIDETTPSLIKNNPYILQKSKIFDLAFQPFYPGGIFCNTNMQWDSGLLDPEFRLPTTTLAQFTVPDIVFFTNSGFRFGYTAKNINLDTSLWIMPTSMPVGVDQFYNYMSSVLNTQNTSLQISRQQTGVNAFSKGFNFLAGFVKNAISGGASGAANNLVDSVNFGVDLTKLSLSYRNQYKMYQAENATARNTLATNINSSVDADTATQMMLGSIWRDIYNGTWKNQWLMSCNWVIMARIPTIPRDIIFYNNLVYLNGFYLNCQIAISSLKLEWNNYSSTQPGIMPHLYYDFDITPDIIKYHYKLVNIELLNAITITFNNGIRFWAGFPDYTKPWYWIPTGKDLDNSIEVSGVSLSPNIPVNSPSTQYTVTNKPTIVPIKQPTSNPVQNAPYNDPGAKPTYGYGSNMNAK